MHTPTSNTTKPYGRRVLGVRWYILIVMPEIDSSIGRDWRPIAAELLNIAGL